MERDSWSFYQQRADITVQWNLGRPLVRLAAVTPPTLSGKDFRSNRYLSFASDSVTVGSSNFFSFFCCLRLSQQDRWLSAVYPRFSWFPAFAVSLSDALTVTRNSYFHFPSEATLLCVVSKKRCICGWLGVGNPVIQVNSVNSVKAVVINIYYQSISKGGLHCLGCNVDIGTRQTVKMYEDILILKMS